MTLRPRTKGTRNTIDDSHATEDDEENEDDEYNGDEYDSDNCNGERGTEGILTEVEDRRLDDDDRFRQ